MGAGKRGNSGKPPRNEDDPPPMGGGGALEQIKAVAMNAPAAANAPQFRPAGMSAAVAASSANLGKFNASGMSPNVRPMPNFGRLKR